MKKNSKVLFRLLQSDGNISINKNLIFAIGLNESILYCELLSRHSYFEIKEQLQDDGSFYNTVDDLELGTGLGDRAQRTAIKNLEKLNLIKCKVRGIPAKRFFYINFKYDLEELLELGETNIEKIRKRKKEIMEEKLVKSTVTANARSCTDDSKNLKPQVKELDLAESYRNNTKPIILTNNTKKEGSEDGREGTKPKGVSTLSVSSIPFYDYVGKLVNSYADISKSLKYDIYESIIYYCSRYEEEFGAEHIRYKTTTLKTVIKKLYDLYTVGIWDEQNQIMVGDDLTLEDFKTMTDKNFMVQFNGKGGKRMSYTLLSFLNDNVLIHRFYEELY